MCTGILRGLFGLGVGRQCRLMLRGLSYIYYRMDYIRIVWLVGDEDTCLEIVFKVWRKVKGMV